MDEKNVRANLVALVAEVTGTDSKQITDGSTLASLGADSLSIVELTEAIEQRFKFLFDEHEPIQGIADIKTLRLDQMVAFLSRRSPLP